MIHTKSQHMRFCFWDMLWCPRATMTNIKMVNFQAKEFLIFITYTCIRKHPKKTRCLLPISNLKNKTSSKRPLFFRYFRIQDYVITLMTGMPGLKREESCVNTSVNKCWCFITLRIFMIRTMHACIVKKENSLEIDHLPT